MSNWNKYASYWTQSSIDCYKRGCKCEGCVLNEIIETHCYMKRAVFELVRKLGAPPNDEAKLSPRQQKVVEAILAGANTKEEIAERAGITVTNTQDVLSGLYEIAECDGVIFKKRYKFEQFKEWIRGENDNV